jgi:hypothetical protein
MSTTLKRKATSPSLETVCVYILLYLCFFFLIIVNYISVLKER